LVLAHQDHAGVVPSHPPLRLVRLPGLLAALARRPRGGLPVRHRSRVVDVLQLIGVTFIGVQCLVLVTRTRVRFTQTAVALAVILVAISPTVWAIDWSPWLPTWAWGYLAPVLGPSFPLFPAV